MNFKNENCLPLSGDTEDINLIHNDYNLSELALQFPNVNSLLIPKKAEHNLRKHVTKSDLRKISSNIDLAVEKCLLFLSNLASTFFVEDKHLEENRWKRLSSKILNRQISGNNTYKKIIEILKEGTTKGAMIEVIEDDIPDVQCRRYRIPENYFKAGLTEYFIKDKGIIQNRNKIYYEQLNEAFENTICNNLIKIYPRIELPSSDELLVIGRRLVKEGYTTKKGKILTLRNKHPYSYWKDSKNRSFVEDNIKLYEYLTNRGFIIPTAGDEKSGGRVVDSFTLMPSWIRAQITIDGKKLTECDYSALHPNIAMKLYGGSQSFLTHESVAEKADIDAKKVKVSHLSFFNMEWEDMMRSPLFGYYKKNEAEMMANIYRDKNKHGHKITSKRMFSAEVEIMTAVIKELNAKEIYVLYVYDALLCQDKDRAVVIDTMNRIILEYGVKTRVKNNEVLPQQDKVESKVEPKTKELPKFGLNNKVNLYDILPMMSFSVQETVEIISDINYSEITMEELVRYIGKQIKEQRYNDYNGVPITSNKIELLKSMIK